MGKQEQAIADALVEQLEDAALNQAFSRKGQSDWMRSLKRLARAQAIMWHSAPIAERLAALAKVDAEMNRSGE